jgi:hypothetical protein
VALEPRFAVKKLADPENKNHDQSETFAAHAHAIAGNN